MADTVPVYQGQDVRFYGSGDGGEFIDVVPRRRNQDTEEQFAVARGQVLGFGDQVDDQHHGQGHQDDGNHNARPHPAAHPVHKSDQGRDKPAGHPGGRKHPLAFFRRFFLHTAQDQCAKGGNAGNGNQQAQGDGTGNGDGDVAKQLAGLLLHKHDGQKYRDGGQGAGQHRAPHLGGAIIGGLDTAFAHLPVAEDILEHHDRVVHDHAHGKTQAGQTDHVDVAAGQGHEEEGTHHADGNGGGDHHCPGDVAQKQQQHHNRQDRSHQQVFLDQVDGVVDVGGLVVNLFDGQVTVFEDAAIEFGQGGLQAVHDQQHVGARLPHGAHDNGGHAVMAHHHGWRFMAQTDSGHVFDRHGDALHPPDNHVGHVFGALVLTHGTGDIPAFALVKVAGADGLVLHPQGADQVRHRDPSGSHGLHIHHHLHLAFFAAVDVDRRDAGKPFQPGLDIFVEKIVLLFQVSPIAVFGHEHHPGDGFFETAAGLDDGPVHVVRVAFHLLHLVGDPQQGFVDIRADLEFQADVAQAVLAFALDLGQAV